MARHLEFRLDTFGDVTSGSEMRDKIGAERGWPPMSRAEFDSEAIKVRSMWVRPKQWRARLWPP